MKYILLPLLFLSFFAHSQWYESKVVEVSTSSHGYLYIRTELNPNPKGCPGTWAGAHWEALNEASQKLAASIALSAKATDSLIRFHIDESKCGAGGLPVMNWIQQR